MKSRWRMAVVTALVAMLATAASSAPAQDARVGAGSDASSSGPGDGVPSSTDMTAGIGSHGTLPSALVPFAGAVDARAYRLGPGDQLMLLMRGLVSRSLPIVVDPEGMILLPGDGSMKVDGRALADVRGDVIARLRGQFRNVELELQLARPRTFRVMLSGQVRVPGPALANGTMRVGDLLGGEQLLSGASRRRIQVRRRDGARQFCDLDRLQMAGDASLNPFLQDGDVVFVPSATEFVFAQGAIARPGRYELAPQDSVLTLLRLAGDPLPAAIVDSLLLVRFDNRLVPDSVWLNLEDVYARRNNPPLGDGAHLYVYFIPRYRQLEESTVLGEVTRPGAYPIVEGRTRLSGLLHAAGGFTSGADLTAIRVHRRSTLANEKDPELDRLLRLSRNELTTTEYDVLNTKLAGLREDYRVDWGRLNRDEDLDLLLRDGDLVRVERLVMSIRVDGQVQRPGILNFVPSRGVSDYVSSAGGFTNRAWPGKVRIIRAVTNQTLLARNVRSLDPGDLIWVPERPDVTVWEQLQRVLTPLAQVATIVIAIRSVK